MYKKLVAQMNDRQVQVMELLICGVVFLPCGRKGQKRITKDEQGRLFVISHQGDVIGAVYEHEVHNTIKTLKDIGIRRSNYPAHGAMTFGFNLGQFGWDYAKVTERTDYYWREYNQMQQPQNRWFWLYRLLEKLPRFRCFSWC